MTIKSDDGVGQFSLQVQHIENPVQAKWIEPEKLALVAETNALRKHNGGYVIAPNAFYEELEALALPSGTYWIRGSIIFENGEYIDQVAIVSHTKR